MRIQLEDFRADLGHLLLGYPRLQERGPVCLACSQLFDNQECREIAHCRNSEVIETTLFFTIYD